ncbi:MAG: hypothetical protein R3E97_17520 [Candidatus Eisenbacteria bacterium]
MERGAEFLERLDVHVLERWQHARRSNEGAPDGRGKPHLSKLSDTPPIRGRMSRKNSHVTRGGKTSMPTTSVAANPMKAPP